jgi:hypothetical protein
MAAAARIMASVLPSQMEPRVANPVFFIGSGRSGTSTLARLLGSHPDVAVFPHEANELWHPGLYPWFRSQRETLPLWRDPYAFTAASLRRRTAADDQRLKALLGSYQRLFRRHYVVNKSVMITFMIPYVLELFPDARFIHLVRDGRAVALSFAKMERRKIDRHPAPYRKSGLDCSLKTLIDDFARHWRQHIAEVETQRRVLNLDSGRRIHELRYEDLCANPRSELTSLARFLKVEPEGFDTRRYAAIENRNYKFRDELDDATVQRISGLMQPELLQKGYGD